MKTSVISLEKVGPAEYKVKAYNGVYIGDFLKKEDGYFDFWPDQKGGFWPSYMLRALAEKLDELNKPWDDDINKFFAEQEENNEPRNFGLDEEG